MKKELIIVVLLLTLIFSSFLGYSTEETNINKKLENFSAELGNKTKSLGQEIVIPNWFYNIAKILFKIDGMTSFSQIVISFVIFFFIFIIIHLILDVAHFFDGWKGWVGALIITCLISISGGINPAITFLIGLGTLFTFFLEAGALKNTLTFIFTIILVIIIVLIVSYLTKTIKNWVRKEEAEATGFKIGFFSSLYSKFTNIFK